MKVFKHHVICYLIAAVFVAAMSHACLGAAAGLEKSVQQMADGNYMIKLRLTARNASIYALKLADPKAAIVDVYAPKGWCIITDGGDFIARTMGSPILGGKTVEFIPHSTTDEIKYTWSVYGKIKQLGGAETL